MTISIIQPSSPYVRRAEMLTTFEGDDAGSVDDIVVLFLGRSPPLIEKIRSPLHAGEAGAVMYAATQQVERTALDEPPRMPALLVALVRHPGELTRYLTDEFPQ